MSDETAETPGDERRPFADYTPADHARVALASDMLFLAGQCHQALIPERWAGDDPPYATAGIRAAASVMERARHLMESAVIAAHESGLTWDQIGRALNRPGTDGITRQSAHARYAPAVAEFRDQLAEAAQGPDPDKAGWTRVCDTAWYAPYLDRVAATTEHPGMLAPPARPGEFLAGLSDLATAAPAQLAAGVRGPDAPPPQCRYTQELDDPYLDDGTRGWLACIGLPEGHPGRHQLAVTAEEF